MKLNFKENIVLTLFAFAFFASCKKENYGAKLVGEWVLIGKGGTVFGDGGV